MKIFIGSSTEAHEKGLLLEIAKIVEECKMIPVRWNQVPSTFETGKFTLENLEEMISREGIDGSIFIYSSDDAVWYRGKKSGKPRDNVIFEHGLFSGKLGRTKSIIVKDGNVKIPTDLLGVTYIDFSEGKKTQGEINLRKWLFDLQTNDISNVQEMQNQFDQLNSFKKEPSTKTDNYLEIRSFPNLEAAKPFIVQKAHRASEIKILANKGLEFFGADSSIISLAEMLKYNNLKRLKILLLSPNSSWVNRGLMALRKYESIEDFKSELDSTHAIVEMGMKKFIRELKLEKSGIKYQKGEPYFRFIMIDNSVFVSTYAEKPTEQVRDLPVFEIEKDYGSLYGSLKKHFNDLWANNSEYGKTFKESIDVEVSAGGFVFFRQNSDVYIALVQRDDGSWVLPKGHKKVSDNSIEETAIREVAEETGLSPMKLRCLKKIDSYAYDESAVEYDVNKINHFYLMEYISDEYSELHTDFEHLSAKWWKIDEELPFMFYIYQKILINDTIEREFHIDAKINDR
ncbi:TIR domain-containing protein [uncultured Neglectibacter sp.]|uniref:TIR domain-containing protein n=1 Tax=uncultured Neglectibacter sp. TaxID=1924108 RepID=UPI0034DE6471